MGVQQFINTLNVIWRSEGVNRGAALARHLQWQVRKLTFPRPVQLRISRSLIVDNQPHGVISAVNMLGLFDFNNMHFVQTVLAKLAGGEAIFIDVGAHIGAYTLIASECPSVHVVSLEPIPTEFAKLERNIALNGRKNVTALNLAASKQAGALRMTCSRSSSCNQIVDQQDTSEETMMVQVETLDGICRRLRLAPSLIKIDVEGHEPEVLAGAVECLASCSACLVENGERASIVALMRNHGMIGPFYYRHRTTTLVHSPQPRPEDPIYLRESFAWEFPGIKIEEGERQGGDWTAMASGSPPPSVNDAGLDGCPV